MKGKSVLISFVMAGIMAVSAVGAAEGLYGNSAAKADASLTIQDMLTYAIQDEYLARGEYYLIMRGFGAARPFTNIVESEENHILWLKDAFATYKIAVPADEATNFIAMPATLKAAFETGVKAEIDNIAMYEAFLKSPVIQGVEHATLRTLFENLKRASENHLRSFKTQLAKY